VSKSEEVLSRAADYSRIEREADSRGRVIGVKRMKPSQQLRVQEWAPGLEGNTTVVAPDGAVREVPKIMPLMIAASVAEIDNRPVPFPKSRAELDSLLDALDEDGMSAATKALNKFAGTEEISADTAKNSAETPA
jgi:hypothetical protein